MGVSSVIALLGIGIATFVFWQRPERAEAAARALPGVHRLLLNKYYVDEIYDATIIQPIKRTSETVLWKGIDAGVIDGAVNGTGATVRGRPRCSGCCRPARCAPTPRRSSSACC